MSINRRMDKEAVDCYSTIKSNAFESVLMRWMNLEPIIKNKVNQKEEKEISYINAYIYMESRKTVLMNVSTGQQLRYRHREQTYGRGEGRRILRRKMARCIEKSVTNSNFQRTSIIHMLI